MRMILTLFFLGMSIFMYSQTYKDHNPSLFNDAITFYKKYKHKFYKVGNKYSLDSKFIFCIVSPEVSNFSLVANFVELNSLNVLYVTGGSEYGNFSVGQFQMKPSFVENLEKEILKYPDLKSNFKHLLFAQENRDSRKKRLDRMVTISGQMQYLGVLCAILKKKKISFANAEDKLIYYATAYNTGFHKSKEQITSEFSKKRFPTFSITKFNYSQIALEFYRAL